MCLDDCDDTIGLTAQFKTYRCSYTTFINRTFAFYKTRRALDRLKLVRSRVYFVMRARMTQIQENIRWRSLAMFSVYLDYSLLFGHGLGHYSIRFKYVNNVSKSLS